ncbi:MAG: RsmE family RNA methyltransferase [Planctomycetaceae bacterium]
MSERFFLATPPRDGRGVLVGDEARHLARVMRCTVGDEVVVFDGGGRSWLARVAVTGRDEVVLAIATELPEERPRRASVTLAVALPKGERQKWLVEKLTELGVDELVPLVTRRGVAEATPAARERLARGVIEACKQCGRDTLLRIAAPRGVDDVVRELIGDALLVVADRDGVPLDAEAVGTRPVIALVGPEGGFTAEELAAVEAVGGRRVSLGPHVLRVETAAIALAARLA